MEDKALKSMVVEDELASPWLRIGASLIDGIIITIVLNIVLLRPNTFPGFINIQALAGIVLFIVYEALLVYYKGATVGKLVFGMQVVDYRTGEKPSLMQCFLRPWAKMAFGVGMINRFLINLLVFAFYIVNFFVLLTDAEHKAIHDKIAGTAVLRANR